jgi:hypothetical protein
MYFSSFYKSRKLKLEFIFDEFSGLKVKKESIAMHGKNAGVYKKYLDGSIELVPIKIVGENKKECIIVADRFYDDDGNEVLTVDYYDEIVKDASSFR